MHILTIDYIYNIIFAYFHIEMLVVFYYFQVACS